MAYSSYCCARSAIARPLRSISSTSSTRSIFAGATSAAPLQRQHQAAALSYAVLAFYSTPLQRVTASTTNLPAPARALPASAVGQLQLPTNKNNTTIHRSFSSDTSSSSPSPFSSPMEWWRDRQETKEAEKYKQRLIDMAHKETWVVGDMLEELREIKDSWAAKIPGVNQQKEIQMGTAMLKAVEGIAATVGADCPAEQLQDMTVKQKLQSAIAGETTASTIDQIVQQLQVMALMQRLVRSRHLQGKPIPTTSEAMQTLLQTEGVRHLSKRQRQKISKRQAQQAVGRQGTFKQPKVRGQK